MAAQVVERGHVVQGIPRAREDAERAAGHNNGDSLMGVGGDVRNAFGGSANMSLGGWRGGLQCWRGFLVWFLFREQWKWDAGIGGQVAEERSAGGGGFGHECDVDACPGAEFRYGQMSWVLNGIY